VARVENREKHLQVELYSAPMADATTASSSQRGRAKRQQQLSVLKKQRVGGSSMCGHSQKDESGADEDRARRGLPARRT